MIHYSKIKDLVTKNWQLTRKNILKRDNAVCQICGKTNSGQIHHIKPRSQGRDDSEKNLIVLCGRCHMFISPVPNFALARAWKLTPSQVLREKTRIKLKYDQYLRFKTRAKK